MSKKRAKANQTPRPKPTLEPVGPDTSACKTVRYATDFSYAWICVAEDCDGEHHFFRRMVWVGPFLTEEEAVAAEDLDEPEATDG